LVCDNQLFIKKTAAGRSKIGTVTEAPPFPGASNWFLMTDLDDPEFLADLARVTADVLPIPKPKLKRAARKKMAKKSSKKRSI
jgi:DNA transformation protein